MEESKLNPENSNNASKKPYLEILVQPEKYCRFRYGSEGGSHGCLEGRRNSTSELKTYPTVKLHNHDGEAIIKCELYEYEHDEEHPHELQVGRSEDRDRKVPFNKSYAASFKHRWIMHIGKKKDLLINKVRKRLKLRLSREEFQKFNKKELQKICKNIDLNRVRLRFSAHDVSSNKEICKPVYSEHINDSKNPDSNELKIIRCSRSSGRPRGGEEILMFVEKIPAGSEKIQVNFFEKCPETNEVIWKTSIPIMKYNIHQQLGIFFDTPPYRDKEIKKSVKVFMELERLKDEQRSEPRTFTYLPPVFVRQSERSYKSVLVQTDPVNMVQITSNVAPSSQTDEISEIIPHDVLNQSPQYVATTSDSFVGVRDPVLSRGLELANTNPNHTVNYEINSPGTTEEQNRFFENDLVRLLETDYFDTDENFQESNWHADSSAQYVQQQSHNESYGEVEDCAYVFFDDSLNESVKVLVQEIKLIVKEKVPGWYAAARMRLEILFGLNLSNVRNTILHALLTSHLPSFKCMVEILSSMRLYDLLNVVNNERQTVLHFAVINDMTDIIPFLIEKGCDPAIKDELGYTAVHQAVKYPSSLEPLLRAIVKKDDAEVKTELDSADEDLDTPLHLAITLRRLECVTLLLEAGLDPLGPSHNAAGSRSSATTIHLAVLCNDLDILRTLLAYIPENDVKHAVNQPSPGMSYLTPLQIACMRPNRSNAVDIMRLLLEKQACPYKSYGPQKPAWELAKHHPAMWAIMKYFVKNEHCDDDGSTDCEDDSGEDSFDGDSSDGEEFFSADEA